MVGIGGGFDYSEWVLGNPIGNGIGFRECASVASKIVC